MGAEVVVAETLVGVVQGDGAAPAAVVAETVAGVRGTIISNIIFN